MKAIRVSIVAISVAAGLWWGLERSVGARLQWEIDERRRMAAELMRQQREHDRLLSLCPTAGELARLRRAVAAQATVASGPRHLTSTRSAFQPGVWAAVASWQNHGRGTAESALETMLWAAAGGDLGVLRDTLEFDETSLAKAGAALERLPANVRPDYGTPDKLLTMLIAGNVPLESAQWVASQVRSENEVTEFVRLRDAQGATRQVYLTLHRDAAGWRLHVPDSAVEGIMQGLTKPMAQ